MLLITLFLMGFICPALADTQVITLKDGSQIKGELVSVGGGVYTVQTAALGNVKVDASQVVNIANGAVAPAANPYASQPPSDNGLNQRIQTVQSKLMSDPNMMAQVQQMTQDPELMQLLSDPSLTQAVLSHDVNAIQNNPKAQELMNNPKMKALMDQLRNSSNNSQ